MRWVDEIVMCHDFAGGLSEAQSVAGRLDVHYRWADAHEHRGQRISSQSVFQQAGKDVVIVVDVARVLTLGKLPDYPAELCQAFVDKKRLFIKIEGVAEHCHTL